MVFNFDVQIVAPRLASKLGVTDLRVYLTQKYLQSQLVTLRYTSRPIHATVSHTETASAKPDT